MFLKKNPTNKIFWGICSGIAEQIYLPINLVRLLFVILPGGIILYVMLGLSIPKSSS